MGAPAVAVLYPARHGNRIVVQVASFIRANQESLLDSYNQVTKPFLLLQLDRHHMTAPADAGAYQ
jgi:hypothetical protein